MYFLIKRCFLLYLYTNNGTFLQSLYLDVHGEIGILMRHVKLDSSFFLSTFVHIFANGQGHQHHARWEEIRKTWLNHGIPTMVARKLESTVDNSGWEISVEHWCHICTGTLIASFDNFSGYSWSQDVPHVSDSSNIH
jgi:E3 ubiquitin-protein ligase UBR1